MIAGCYDLHLYCDGLGCEAGKFRLRAEFEYTHEFGSAARAVARRNGWRLFRSQHCLCPSCVKRGAKVDPEA